MNRSKFSLVLAAILSLVMALPAAAAPKKGKGKAAKKEAPQKVPVADDKEIAKLMGPFKWGMTPDQVTETLGKSIDERYAEKIKEATGDVYAQDTLRKKAKEEKARIKKSFIEFKGQKTPWEVSIVQGEFDHKNGESMIELWEKEDEGGRDQRRFFFFKDEKLWKMFIAFNSEKFENAGFQEFKGAMENRYGVGKPELSPNGVAYVHWRSKRHYLRALDLTRFYGNFVLAVSDNRVESTIYAERDVNNPKVEKKNKVVDSVVEEETTEGSDKKGLNNPNENVIDDIVGSPPPKKK